MCLLTLAKSVKNGLITTIVLTAGCEENLWNHDLWVQGTLHSSFVLTLLVANRPIIPSKYDQIPVWECWKSISGKWVDQGQELYSCSQILHWSLLLGKACNKQDRCLIRSRISVIIANAEVVHFWSGHFH